MKILSRLIRLLRINFILARYNIDEVILGTHQFYLLRFISYANPYYWTSIRKLPRGERIRRALEDLGPIFVKAGQILSTRRDLLPDDIANELAKLQDRVPPFESKFARKLIEQGLGAPIEVIFSSFDQAPLASASIAQVHAATLLNGDAVVVKVLRPKIKEMIERDIDLFMGFAGIAERYWPYARQFKPIDIVNEIAFTLRNELDLTREAANASQLRRNLAQSPLLYIPKVYWSYSCETVLVIERIYGVPVHDKVSLIRAKVNMKKLAERGIEIFFTQVFRDSFFHADLHPGNIFVNVNDPENPTYIAVDFGIVGSLNQHDQRYLAENMMAFFKRDYQRVAELHIACGWLPPETRIDQFEAAIRAVSEPMFERPMKDISFGQLLLRLFQVARQFHVNIQPQLILLQKTLLSIEGLSRELTPGLDIWASAAPHIEKWLKNQIGIKAFLKRVKNNLPLLSEQLPEIPNLIYEVLKETKEQQERKRFHQAENHKKMKLSASKEKANKIIYFLMGSASVLVGLLIYTAWVG